VPFDVVHPTEAIKELYTMLQAHQKQPLDASVDVYESNTRLILEKLTFLLRKVASPNEDADETTYDHFSCIHSLLFVLFFLFLLFKLVYLNLVFSSVSFYFFISFLRVHHDLVFLTSRPYFRKLTEKPHRAGLSQSQKSPSMSSSSSTASQRDKQQQQRRAFMLEDAESSPAIARVARDFSSGLGSGVSGDVEEQDDEVLDRFAKKNPLSKYVFCFFFFFFFFLNLPSSFFLIQCSRRDR
jgi:hypothetical protein